MECSGHSSTQRMPREHQQLACDISFTCHYLNLNPSEGFLDAPSTARAPLGQAERSNSHSEEPSSTLSRPEVTRRREPCCASHSPIEHLEDNSYLVVYPEHPNLAEAAEESGKGCFMSWGRNTAEVDSLPEKGVGLFLSHQTPNHWELPLYRGRSTWR